MEDELKSDAAVLVQNAFRGLLAVLFYLGPSATHDVVIHGRENVSDWHPKLLVSNHKREMDSFVLQGVLYLARGIVRPNELLTFALREDAYWPGFLANFIRLPGVPGEWLAKLDLSPVIRLLKAYPMGMLRSRADHARMQGQLTGFAQVLDRGHDLYWAPEGGLGLDGHLEPFRAGLHRVVEASHAELRILPVSIVYDFMTSGRTRCAIRIGPEFAYERSWSRRELDDRVRRALLHQMTLNVGHVMAAVLREWPAGVARSLDGVEVAAHTHVRRLAAMGVPLDGRLSMRWTFRRRLRQFLAYARKNGVLQFDGRDWRVAQGLAHPKMRYVRNELEDVEQSRAEVIPPLSPI